MEATIGITVTTIIISRREKPSCRSAHLPLTEQNGQRNDVVTSALSPYGESYQMRRTRNSDAWARKVQLNSKAADSLWSESLRLRTARLMRRPPEYYETQAFTNTRRSGRWHSVPRPRHRPLH